MELPVSFEEYCANPYCHHAIDPTNTSIIYCGGCQTVLRDYSAFFPKVEVVDIFLLFSRKRVTVSFAERVLGLPHGLLFGYCYRQRLASGKVGQKRLIASRLVIDLGRDLATAITVPEAARRLGIDKQRLYFLIKRNRISMITSVLGRVMIRIESLERVKKIDETLRSTKRQRKSESLKSKPNTREYSTSQIAKIFDVAESLITRYFRSGLLAGYKRKNRWYTRERSLRAFSRKILKRKHAKQVMREGAQRCLDQSAAG